MIDIHILHIIDAGMSRVASFWMLTEHCSYHSTSVVPFISEFEASSAQNTKCKYSFVENNLDPKPPLLRAGISIEI